MNLTTLYKRDSTGKIRVYKTYTDDAKLIQEAGVLNGKLVKQQKTCKPKNVGRSNETSGPEQAALELASRVAKKVNEGYWLSLETAQNNKQILPMLAKDYTKESTKVSWVNTFLQPKLDGMRCLAFIEEGKVTLMSRKGKAIETVKHIEDDLANFNDVILDGELYVHGKNFQENMRLIKKYRPGETEQVKYHVYDTVSTEPFRQRMKALREHGQVAIVPTSLCLSEKDMLTQHKSYIKGGFEGTIIRHSQDPYAIDKRSSSLLKYKEFIDLALPIIDIEPAEQRPEWGVPVFNYKSKEFRAGVRMTHEARIHMLTHKEDFIGKTAELRFFEYSEDDIPRFPIMVGLRLDK